MYTCFIDYAKCIEDQFHICIRSMECEINEMEWNERWLLLQVACFLFADPNGTDDGRTAIEDNRIKACWAKQVLTNYTAAPDGWDW